jgi:hypothetical protein
MTTGGLDLDIHVRGRDERDIAQKRQDMLRLAQRNRRFARLVEVQARTQEQGRKREANIAMAQSLRDTAEQLEAQVRDNLRSRDLLHAHGPGETPTGSGA